MPNGNEHLTSGDFVAADVAALRRRVDTIEAELIHVRAIIKETVTLLKEMRAVVEGERR